MCPLENGKTKRVNQGGIKCFNACPKMSVCTGIASQTVAPIKLIASHVEVNAEPSAESDFAIWNGHF